MVTLFFVATGVYSAGFAVLVLVTNINECRVAQRRT